ncbi:glutamate-cysteine ligase family protein [Halarsenatibacter silvermanii]|uniref:Glutamate--cysteine ligase n=1 Tax=Halarsenatibacter silvermanii TaxID=321763 RepID=A0A1G9LLJ8_9FIRM|nr:glutamate-cysteine ligase family protein [Halarsenatibacter silvermanii]SDL62385.1 glutamate--cysteine ligase [Halarsenatibacter silvermanii]
MKPNYSNRKRTKKRYLDQIEDYFRKNSTGTADYRLGVEFEFFIIKNSTTKAVTYFESEGINDIFKEMAGNGWNICDKAGEDQILGLRKNGDEINLEPGGQLEYSFAPKESLQEIDGIFKNFCREIFPLLNARDYSLISLGYQPVTVIEELPLLPKKRYKHMYNYFADKGKWAHNMMKGSAALQVSIDYSSEADFRDKFAAAAWLTPVIYAVFDNSPFMEGRPASFWGVRSQIWRNCDDDRSGLPPGCLRDDFSFRDYARFILELPAIFDPEDDSFTGDKAFWEILTREEMAEELIQHMFTMAFTDVRAKNYLELRMADSLPYPLCLGYISFIKGLFYREENLQFLKDIARETGRERIESALAGIPLQGVELEYSRGKSIKNWQQELFSRARKGLNDRELKNLDRLEGFLRKYLPPRTAFQNGGQKNDEEIFSLQIEDLDYCNLNALMRGRL